MWTFQRPTPGGCPHAHLRALRSLKHNACFGCAADRLSHHVQPSIAAEAQDGKQSGPWRPNKHHVIGTDCIIVASPLGDYCDPAIATHTCRGASALPFGRAAHLIVNAPTCRPAIEPTPGSQTRQDAATDPLTGSSTMQAGVSVRHRIGENEAYVCGGSAAHEIGDRQRRQVDTQTRQDAATDPLTGTRRSCSSTMQAGVSVRHRMGENEAQICGGSAAYEIADEYHPQSDTQTRRHAAEHPLTCIRERHSTTTRASVSIRRRMGENEALVGGQQLTGWSDGGRAE